MHPWTQYQIRRIEIDRQRAQAARERMLVAGRRDTRRQTRLASRLNRALAWLGSLLTRVGQRLEQRAKPIPATACSEVCM